MQDKDRSTKSRELVSSFVNSGYFSLVGYVDSPSELDRLVDEGRVRAILTIPSGFEHDLSLRQPVTVQVIIDGDNANTASTVSGYARTLINEFSGAQVRLALSEGPAPQSRTRVEGFPSFRWNRASGTTRSFAARCFSCRG